MTKSWASCSCFFQRNIYLPELGHVAFSNMKQFEADYSLRMVGKDVTKIVKSIHEEIKRRKDIATIKEENKKNIAKNYRQLYAGLFREENFFNFPKIADIREELPRVYSFNLLSRHQCEVLLNEFLNFSKSSLEFQRPNSMNKNGLLVEELGLDHQISYIVKAVESLAKEKFPELVGEIQGLDTFKAFTVEYKSDGLDSSDSQLATHFDNAEVTLNVPLTEDFAGSELYFQTQRGFEPVNMELGRAILHSGRQQHAVLPIMQGYRYNLIIWMRSSEIRNRLCPMCNEVPSLEKSLSGTGDGFTM